MIWSGFVSFGSVNRSGFLFLLRFLSENYFTLSRKHYRSLFYHVFYEGSVSTFVSKMLWWSR